VAVVTKSLKFLLFLLAATPGRAEIPAIHATVSGQVGIEKSCGKAGYADVKLLVSAVRAIDYQRPQIVPIDEQGRFEVSLHQSYDYRFTLLMGGETVGTARYEPRYPHKNPVITAHCKVAEKSDAKSDAKPGAKPAH
jgi:hypothetical protein